MGATILLIRHGETAWNRGKIFRGTHDVPLNETGVQQARLVGQVLKTTRIDAAYTSPLQRAVLTAELALDGRGIKLGIEGRLTDFDYGEWTGLEEAEVQRRWRKEFGAWRTRPHAICVPGGNTLQEVFDACFAAMEEIAERHADGTVALFAHRVVNKLLCLGALGLGLDRFPFIRQDNCCISQFERIAEGYVVHRLNDTSHLRGNVAVLGEDF